MSLQDAYDGSWCNSVPKFLEFSADLVVSPVGILSGESDDEAFKLWIYLGPPSAAIGIVRPFSSHQLAMPAQNALRLEDADDLTKFQSYSASC